MIFTHILRVTHSELFMQSHCFSASAFPEQVSRGPWYISASVAGPTALSTGPDAIKSTCRPPSGRAAVAMIQSSPVLCSGHGEYVKKFPESSRQSPGIETWENLHFWSIVPIFLWTTGIKVKKTNKIQPETLLTPRSEPGLGPGARPAKSPLTIARQWSWQDEL